MCLFNKNYDDFLYSNHILTNGIMKHSFVLCFEECIKYHSLFYPAIFKAAIDEDPTTVNIQSS